MYQDHDEHEMDEDQPPRHMWRGVVLLIALVIGGMSLVNPSLVVQVYNKTLRPVVDNVIAPVAGAIADAAGAVAGAVGDAVSGVTDFVTGEDPLKAVTGVDVQTGNRQLVVTWSPVTGTTPDGYRVFVDGTVACTTPTGQHTCTVDGLENGRDYKITVAPYDERGDGPISPEQIGTPRAVPGMPDDLALRVNGLAATATWRSPADSGGAPVTSYEIRTRTDDDTWTEPVVVTELTHELTGLRAAGRYTVSVRAVNAVGAGPWQTSTEVVAYRTPDSPNAVTATETAGTPTGITVAFVPSAFDGGRPITGYTATCTSPNGATRTATGATSPLSITNLDPARTYTCAVVATNVAGPSAATTADAPLVPYTVPGTPTGVTARLADPRPNLLAQSFGLVRATAVPTNAIEVSFTAPTFDGGRPITGYTATCASATAAPVTATAASSPVLVNGVTAGAAYTCAVVAQNAAGSSTTSAPTASVTPFRSADAPTLTTAAIDPTEPTTITIEVAAGAFDGGRPVTGYTATCTSTDGGRSRTGDSTWTSLRVTGLDPSRTYTCSAVALNAAGSSDPTAPSGSLVPYTTPDAVTGVNVALVAPTRTGTVSETVVTFDAPAFDGGRPVTSFEVRCATPSTVTTATVTESPARFTNLTPGVTHTCTVRARNLAGASSGVLSVGFVPYRTADTPTDTTATIDTESPLDLTVESAVPVFDGGRPITAYRAVCTSSTGGATRSTTGTTPALTVTGLTPAASYRCTTAAQNEAGWSDPSAASEPVVPYTTPDAPTIATGVIDPAAPRDVALTIAAASFDGGRPVTAYRADCVSTNGGAPSSVMGTEPAVTLTGLTPAKTYACTVATRNLAGWSAPSASSWFIPYTTPDAPEITTVLIDTDAPDEVTVSTLKPVIYTGGRPITEYEVTCSSTDGGLTRTATVVDVPMAGPDPIRVTDLTPGRTYSCEARAKNLAGWSAWSTTSETFVPYRTPDAPTATAELVAPTADEVSPATITVSHATFDGGRPVTSYRVTCVSPDGGTPATGTGTDTTFTLTGLTAAKTYTCTAESRNTAGWSVESTATEALVPYRTPDAPTATAELVAPTADEVSPVVVDLTAAAFDGGRAVTSYRATCSSPDGGTTATFTSSKRSITLTGLTPAKTYTCTGEARNLAGWSPASNTTAELVAYRTPDAPTATAELVAPLGTEVSPITVAVTPAGFDGGRPVTSYHVVCSSTDGGAEIAAFSTGTDVRVSGLTAAKTYTCAARSQNAAGWSPSSPTTAELVPYRIPDAPTITSVTIDVDAPTYVTVVVAPTFEGGRPVTRSSVTCSSTNGGTTRINTGDGLVRYFGNLTPGATYTCIAGVMNLAGWSNGSAASDSFVPYTLPSAPTGLTGVPGDGTVVLSWTDAEPNGRAITDYEVRAYTDGVEIADSPRLVGSAATAYAWTGLTNGTAYTFQVAGVNLAGTGPQSDATTAHTPASYPTMVAAAGPVAWWRLDEPSGTAAYDSAGTATGTYQSTPTLGHDPALAAIADTSVRFSATSQETMTAPDADAYSIGTTGALTVQGWFKPYVYPTAGTDATLLGKGTTANFEWAIQLDSAGTAWLQVWNLPGTVRYVNRSFGTLPTTSFTYLGATMRAVGDQLSFLLYRNDALVTHGTVTANVGNGSAPVRIGDLNAASSGLVVAAAHVAIYDRALTDAQHAAFHRAGVTGVNPGLRTATPTGFTADFGDRSASLTWNTTTGAQRYRVYRNNVLRTVTTSSALTDTGLTNGTTYTYRVAAVDARGNESASTAALEVVPATVPTAPVSTSASLTPDHLGITVGFAAPTNDGGAAVSNYRATCTGTGGATGTATGAASPLTVTGLTTGVAYSCTVAAYNKAGWSNESAPLSANDGAAASDPLATLVPYTTPDAPVITNAAIIAATPTSATVAVTAPTSNGGRVVTSYRVDCTSADGGTTRSAAAFVNAAATGATLTVASLTAGATYTCVASAQNLAGWSAASAPSPSLLAYNLPTAVTGLTAAAGDRSATATWTAKTSTPSDPVTGYRVTVLRVVSTTDPITGFTTTTDETVTEADVTADRYTATGLTNGDTYRFLVRTLAYTSISSGTTSASVVAHVPLALAYSQQTLTRAADAKVWPTASGGWGASSFSVSGTLPYGVSFDTTTGQFRGTGEWRFRVTKVVAGTRHSCALLTDGTVKCWGNRTVGQVGDGTFDYVTPRLVPVTVSGLADVVDLSAGSEHTCAALTNGTVKCWGNNGYRQLGDGTTLTRVTPVLVAGVSGAVDVEAGWNHTCARLSDGTATCWGDNSLGQLGDGSILERTSPVTVTGLSGVVALAAGDEHTCAVLVAGTVKCWGENTYGELGDGTRTPRYTPVSVSALYGVTQLTAASAHTCARLSEGLVKCWGANSTGQLGDGTTIDRSTPVTVTGLANVVEVDGNYLHTCARLKDSTAKCWGANFWGQLGDGSGTATNAPIAVPGLTGATGIAGGDYHSCAVFSNGTLKCWGRNTDGQLGDGTTTTRRTPTPTSGTGPETWIPRTHTVTMTDSVGHTKTTTVSLGVAPVAPVGVTATGGVSGRLTLAWAAADTPADGYLVRRGATVVCDLATDATATATGCDVTGLTDGTTYTLSIVAIYRGVESPAATVEGTPYAPLALAYNQQTLTRTASSTVAPTTSGGLGARTYSHTGSLPAGVTFDTATGTFTGPAAWTFRALQISGGSEHACALAADGTVRCWGYNFYSQLGDGTTTTTSTPVPVAGITNATAVAAGAYHSCALLASGEVRCWGNNANGRLGDGSVGVGTTPVTVIKTDGTNLTDVRSLSAGRVHTCAVTYAGTTWCWGGNNAGQAGDGTTTNRSRAVQVKSGVGTAALTGVSTVTAANDHTCAVLSAGTVSCWGLNSSGELGDGTTTNRSYPTAVPGISDASMVANGWYHTCVLRTTGTVACWGYGDNGELGNGAATSSLTPVAVTGLATARHITGGERHSCAVLASGSVTCWGLNNRGQLGDGTTTNRAQPVTVTSLAGATAVTGTWSATCALTNLGAVSCFGGPLGSQDLPAVTTTPTPVPLTGQDLWYGTSYTVTVTDSTGSTTAPLTLTPAPDAPYAVTVTRATATTATVSWAAPKGGADAYRVTVDDATADGCATVTTTSCVVTTTGTQTFRVFAVRNGVAGPASAPVFTAPVSQASITGSPVSAGVQLAWSATGATSYVVQQSSNSDGPWRTLDVADLTAIDVTGLTNDTTYHFRAAGRTNGMPGPWSATIAVTPVATPALYATTMSKTTGTTFVPLASALGGFGETYTAGLFSGAITVGGTTHTSAGGNDIFITRLTPAGAVAWSRRLGTLGGDRADAVVLNGATLYVAATFASPTVIDGVGIPVAGSSDAVILTLDALTGTVRAATTLGSSTSATVEGLALVAGDLVAFGHYSGTARTITSQGANDWWAARITTAGTWVWFTTGGGTGNDRASDLAVGGDGTTIYVAGPVDAAVAFGTHQGVVRGGTDVAVARLSLDGQWLGVTMAGSAGNDDVLDLTTDADGGIYASGTVDDDATFGTVNIEAQEFRGVDAYLARLGLDGTWQWAVETVSSAGFDSGYAVTAANGAVFVGGSYRETGYLSGASSIVSAGGTDAFLSKYDATGAREWTKTFGSTGDDAIWVGLLTFTDRRLFVPFAFQGTVLFEGRTLTSPAGVTSVALLRTWDEMRVLPQ